MQSVPNSSNPKTNKAVLPASIALAYVAMIACHKRLKMLVSGTVIIKKIGIFFF